MSLWQNCGHNMIKDKANLQLLRSDDGRSLIAYHQTLNCIQKYNIETAKWLTYVSNIVDTPIEPHNIVDGVRIGDYFYFYDQHNGILIVFNNDKVYDAVLFDDLLPKSIFALQNVFVVQLSVINEKMYIFLNIFKLFFFLFQKY
eukprot:2594_1